MACAIVRGDPLVSRRETVKYIHPPAVGAVDDVDEGVGAVEVVPPVGSNRFLTARRFGDDVPGMSRSRQAELGSI